MILKNPQIAINIIMFQRSMYDPFPI